MPKELDYDFGVDVTLTFAAANPAANATTALTLAQGGAGFVVPPGYKFHALCLSGGSNADLTAGNATFVVRATPAGGSAGTVAGLSTALADTVQSSVALAHVGAVTVPAGAVVGLAVVTDAAYAPVTADLDAVLIGKLLPA